METTTARKGENKRGGAMIALVAMQGTFLNAKKVVTRYPEGALIYPSVRTEGTESATRHCARLLTQRRVAKLDKAGEPVIVDGEVQYEDLEACVITLDNGFAAHRYYGVDEMTEFFKGRSFTVSSGKLPSSVALARTRAKASDRRKAAKAEKVEAVEADTTVSDNA